MLKTVKYRFKDAAAEEIYNGKVIKGSPGAAGYDLRACDRYERSEHYELWGLGVMVEIPEGYFGMLVQRSGLKYSTLCNSVGIIDSDYRGEIKARICALPGGMEYSLGINRGDRIVQLVIVPYESADWELVQELSPTLRGTGGFGSTGER